LRSLDSFIKHWLKSACKPLYSGGDQSRIAPIKFIIANWERGMAITVINPKEIALREKKRTVVMNTRKLHAWVHYYPNPGDHDEMHCHNEDQVFTCFEGQCTMHFPDGTSQALDPGMAALINGGSFYKLENTGAGPMIMMGHRSGSQDTVKIIDYVTRKDIRAEGKEPRISNPQNPAQ